MCVEEEEASPENRNSVPVGLYLVLGQIARAGQNGTQLLDRQVMSVHILLGKNKKVVITGGNSPLDLKKIRQSRRRRPGAHIRGGEAGPFRFKRKLPRRYRTGYYRFKQCAPA